MTCHNRLRIPLCAAMLLLGAPLLHAQAASPADAPETLRPPAGAKLVLAVHATGVQIYVCAAAADGRPQWTLKAPDAKLHDAHGTVVGHHSAGPSWKYKDGSEVTGKAAAHVDSPDPQSVPWLLVSVVGHSGSGLLEQVTSIQRLHTHGGAAPAAGCDASAQGHEARIPYSADYYFYTAVAR
jgi:Protein of unknown function (DUF3455)